MTILAFKGARGTTYGFEFVQRGWRVRVKGFASRSMAKTAEERERRRLDPSAFETQPGAPEAETDEVGRGPQAL